ncbi:reprolysin-like metallopeptidase [Luteimonas lutimaris]|uniref:Peptidase M12B domain-containing protein n=1 Tax=Luteimonas lutimaris TaxID=698645 RepID=A0ABP7MYP1_9GAMM
MRNYLTAGIVLGLLAGCSSDQDPATAKAGATVADSALMAHAGAAFTSRAPMSGVASLPDRGELLAYEKSRPATHSGAYSAYPVAISEAHALNAMRTGEMVINTPDGEPIRLTYERHEEGKDGNWTWIGRNAEGASAVITFGEKAVFGVIPQGATDSLSLRTSAGQPWLVQTDRSKLAGMNGMPRRDAGDQLLPPAMAGAMAARTASATTALSAPVMANASASAAVVDVLLGYTPGFVTGIGSESGAVTRLVNMAAIANDAYANSGVNMRIRLVKTLKVNYADDTDNSDALQKLTGYEAGEDGGPIDVDPAFKELREMRDEVGADLVSLVRAFRTPQNNGCGIAWLIGSEQSGISAQDEPFGYSVVSDGNDKDEDDGYTYGCSQETLAHELGHNMGQAHNEEDSKDDDGNLSYGLHEYSFGYRESSSTGFYTVMSYPHEDGNQTGIRYFANPAIKYDGRPTGVANKSDNARSMNQSMPVVAQFRETVIPAGFVRNDVDGNGKSDLVFRNRRNGANAIWLSADYATQQPMTTVTSQAWKVVGNGDFDGDGQADILWRNSTTGANAIWKSGNYDTQQDIDNVTDKSWIVAGVGDFDGDGKSDILWRKTSNGANTIWRSGDSASQMSTTTVSLSWMVAGVGDFDGDGFDDILWYTRAGGKSTIWKRGNSGNRQSVTSVSDKNWEIVGIGNFNGDSSSDMLWRHRITGKTTIWKSANSSSQQAVGVVNLDWSPVAIGDYDGDGRSDIFWRNSKNGRNVYWKGGNPATQQSVTAITNLDWEVQD